MTLRAYLPGTRSWRARRAQELCHRTGRRIQEIVDGELPPGRATRALERHLAACKRCGSEAEAVRTLKRAIARVSREADPQTIRRLEDLAHTLSDEGGTLPAMDEGGER